MDDVIRSFLNDDESTGIIIALSLLLDVGSSIASIVTLLQMDVRDCSKNRPNAVRHGITMTMCLLLLTSVLYFDFVVDDDPGVRNVFFGDGVDTRFLNENGVVAG